MSHSHRDELFIRYEGNPILTAGQCPHTVNSVFNPGVVEFDVPDYGVSHTTLSRYFARPGVAAQVKQAEQLLRAEQRAAEARWRAEQKRDTLPIPAPGLFRRLE